MSLLSRNDLTENLTKDADAWKPSFLQMAVLSLVMILWNADNMALPAVYEEIAQHFNLTPGDLGGLGLARGVFESISALPAGFLAARLPRPPLISLGCLIWASGNLGQTAFTALATSIAPLRFGSVAGWQFALILISVLSALIGLLVFMLVTDVPQAEDETDVKVDWKLSWDDLKVKLRKVFDSSEDAFHQFSMGTLGVGSQLPLLRVYKAPAQHHLCGVPAWEPWGTPWAVPKWRQIYFEWYHKMSLQYHPDKVGGGEAATKKFNEIKSAREILQDVERRKIYDTFGTDLGEERPELEVWTIGVNTLLSPMGNFVLKTVMARLVLWLVGWVWIGRLFIFLGFVAAGLYWQDVKTLG
eukprot:Skav233916  [mRNA]  locus=scaffold435:582928:602422:+ [translate_table: standard]